jgi:hypothetical protein
MTKNYQDDHGVTDVSSTDIRCFQMRAGTGTATVAAGDDLGFVADQGVTHPGPVQFYMARVPEGKDINTWEATGNVWFKVASINGVNPAAKTSGFTWPTYSMDFPLPQIKEEANGTGKTRKLSALPSPSPSRAASISSALRVLRSTRPSRREVLSSTWPARRSRSRAAETGRRDRWWRFRGRIGPAGLG